MNVRVVTSPSPHRETWAVARAIFHVLYWSALVVSAETWRSGDASASTAAIGAFERRYQDLAAPDQRLFRALQEGIAEAERLRAATGAWPDVAALASAGVPPFAADPLDRAGYTWRRLATGRATNYVGTPVPGAARDTFVVVIAEPEPGTPDDPLAATDEVHHRLAKGPMIHVGIWTGPPLAGAREAVALLPQERGYRQVLATSAGAPDPRVR